MQSELNWVRFRRAGGEPSLSLVNPWIKLSDPIVWQMKLLVVVVFTNHFRNYFLGRAFTIRTDHASLVWLMRLKQISGQLSHWLETLSQFAYIIEHRSGKNHCNADGLSRIPERAACDCYIAGQNLNSLPCGGCTICTKMHNQWKRFERDVDDVLPLAIHHVQREEFNPVGEGSSVARSKHAGWDKRGFHLLGDGPSLNAPPLGSSEIEGDFISDTECGLAVDSGWESADGPPLLSEVRKELTMHRQLVIWVGIRHWSNSEGDSGGMGCLWMSGYTSPYVELVVGTSRWGKHWRLPLRTTRQNIQEIRVIWTCSDHSARVPLVRGMSWWSLTNSHAGWKLYHW